MSILSDEAFEKLENRELTKDEYSLIPQNISALEAKFKNPKKIFFHNFGSLLTPEKIDFSLDIEPDTDLHFINFKKQV